MLETSEPSFWDWEAGRQARDEGLEKVEGNNSGWVALALIQLREIAKNPSGWGNLENGFTGETIRMMVTPHVGKPRSPNAYGALVMAAIKKNIIVPTGRLTPMVSKSSHYRKTMVYIFGDGALR
jgi:hypothetical protein